MHHIAVHISKCLIPFKVKRVIPSFWEEVTPLQLQHIAYYVMAGNTLMTFLILSRLPVWLFKLVHDEAKQQLIDLVGFTQHFHSKPIISLEGYHCNGTDITVQQFAWADFYFFKIAKGLDIEESLAKLIACLYVPTGEDFDDHHIDHNYKAILKLPEGQRLAVLLYYRGFRKQLVSQYKEIFEAPYTASDPDIKPVAPPEEADPELMFHLINELSKSGQYGNYRSTCLTKLDTVLYHKRLDMKFNKPERP